jgi:DNA-binding MarR family transcriptional regulator
MLIPDSILTSDLPATGRLVLLVLHHLATKQRTPRRARVGAVALAKLTGLSRVGVLMIAMKLEDAGYIEVVRDRHTANVYILREV